MPIFCSQYTTSHPTRWTRHITFEGGVDCYHISHVILVVGTLWLEEMIFPCARKKDPSAKGSTDVTWAADVEFQRRWWLFFFFFKCLFHGLVQSTKIREGVAALSQAVQPGNPTKFLFPNWVCAHLSNLRVSAMIRSFAPTIVATSKQAQRNQVETMWKLIIFVDQLREALQFDKDCSIFGYNSIFIRWDLDHCDPWNFCCKFAPSKTCR